MKKVISLVMMGLLLNAGVCLAEEVVLVPDTCKEVKSATFSSGAGKRAIVYAKILCLMDDDSYVLYMPKKVSAGSLLNIGRITIPSVVRIKKVKGITKAEWD